MPAVLPLPSMPAVAARTLTFAPDEYVAWEAGQLERHEYHFGEVFPMPGGTFEHARLIMALGAALVSALRGSDCLVLSEAMRVEVLPDLQFVYPDVTVVCGEPALRDATETTLQNPTVLCEVLSPTTARYDRGEKFALYRGVPSVQAVVYVDPDARTVEVRQRTAAGWAVAPPVREGTVEIGALGVALAIEALFGSA